MIGHTALVVLFILVPIALVACVGFVLVKCTSFEGHRSSATPETRKKPATHSKGNSYSAADS